MNKMNEFLYGDFTPTEKDHRLYELAARYHEETEAYDMTVCSGRNERGIAMPTDAHEVGSVALHAIKVLNRLYHENPDIERVNLLRAISRYSAAR